MPSRRSFLVASAGTLVGFAGCTDSVTGPETDTTTTGSTTPTQSTPTTAGSTTTQQDLSWAETATVDGTDVTPVHAAVQQSAFHLTMPDSADVLSFEDRTAVFLTVVTDGDRLPALSDFEFSAGDAAAGWTEYGGVGGIRFFEQGSPYNAQEADRGWIGFDVADGVSDEDPRLHLQFDGADDAAVRWSLSEDEVAAFQSPPPEFAVTRFDSPETVRSDEAVTVSATIENRGERSGTFRAVCNELGPEYTFDAITFDLDPGESRTWDGRISSHTSHDDVETVRFDFRSPEGTYEREVEITET